MVNIKTLLKKSKKTNNIKKLSKKETEYKQMVKQLNLLWKIIVDIKKHRNYIEYIKYIAENAEKRANLNIGISDTFNDKYIAKRARLLLQMIDTVKDTK